MAYEPTVWKNGDVITAEKLNKLENGIPDDSPIFIVNCDDFIITEGTGTVTFVDCTKEDILNSCAENPNTKIHLNISTYVYGPLSVHLYLSDFTNTDDYQGASFTSDVYHSSSAGLSVSVFTLFFSKQDTNPVSVYEFAVAGKPLIEANNYGGVWKVNNIDAVKAVYNRCNIEPVLVQVMTDGTKLRMFRLVSFDPPIYSEWDFLYSGIETIDSVTSMVYQKCHVDSTGVCTFSPEYRVTLS